MKLGGGGGLKLKPILFHMKFTCIVCLPPQPSKINPRYLARWSAWGKNQSNVWDEAGVSSMLWSGLWLVESDHVTWILASDWSRGWGVSSILWSGAGARTAIKILISDLNGKTHPDPSHTYTPIPPLIFTRIKPGMHKGCRPFHSAAIKQILITHCHTLPTHTTSHISYPRKTTLNHKEVG